MIRMPSIDVVTMFMIPAFWMPIYPASLRYDNSKYISYAFFNNLAISTWLKPASVKFAEFKGHPVKIMPLYDLFAH